MPDSTSFGVVIPTYQRRDTVGIALDSVLFQNFKNLAVIIVDDGSTDGTEEALRKVRDHRFSLVRQENQGRCRARNVGAETLGQDWLVFLDSDDELMPGALEHLDQVIRAESPDMVVGASLRQNLDGTVVRRGSSWNRRHRLPDALVAGAFAIRRSLFDAVGGYCTALEFSEHTEMAFKMRTLQNKPRVVATERSLVRVVERGGRYSPQVQLQSALHLLDHIALELDEDRHARSMFHGIAGVSAAKLGMSRDARIHLARAFTDEPRARSAIRLANVMLPGGNDRWARRTAPGDTSTAGGS